MDDENYPMEMAAKSVAGAIQARRLDITIRQNIDEQIKQAEARVEELKAIRDRLQGSGILDSRIEDIRQAMRF